MNELRVVVQAIAQKEVIYRFDPGVDEQLIFLCNPRHREMAYAINIAGGRIIIGLDRHRFLNNLEIIRPRRNRGALIHRGMPTRVGEIGIQFPYITERLVCIDIPIAISVEEGSAAISLGEGEDGMWVDLSNSLSVMISGGELQGFFVQLR